MTSHFPRQSPPSTAAPGASVIPVTARRLCAATPHQPTQEP